MSELPTFGWHDNEAPDIDAANLEAERQDIATWVRAQVATDASSPTKDEEVTSGSAGFTRRKIFKVRGNTGGTGFAMLTHNFNTDKVVVWERPVGESERTFRELRQAPIVNSNTVEVGFAPTKGIIEYIVEG